MKDYYPPLEPGRWYHVFNRGNNRETIFPKPENHAYFLKKYSEYMSIVLDTYVYNLLPNHFHLVVRVKNKEEIRPESGRDFPSLEDLESLGVEQVVSELFRRFFMAYSKAINKQQGRVGSLLQKNFKRLAIQSEGHFTNLVYYVHTNAQLHGLCSDFKEWPYSSYASILSDSPTQLKRDMVLEWFSTKEAFVRYHEHYLASKNSGDWVIED